MAKVKDISQLPRVNNAEDVNLVGIKAGMIVQGGLADIQRSPVRLNDTADLDLLKTPGFYRTGPMVANLPPGFTHTLVEVGKMSEAEPFQFAICPSKKGMAFRYGSGMKVTTWNEWVIFEGKTAPKA